MSERERTMAMRRNAAVLDRFMTDCANTGRKVIVGLSSNQVPKPGAPEAPAKDLVIRVRSVVTSRDCVMLSERVTGSMTEAVELLRRKLALA